MSQKLRTPNPRKTLQDIFFWGGGGVLNFSVYTHMFLGMKLGSLFECQSPVEHGVITSLDFSRSFSVRDFLCKRHPKFYPCVGGEWNTTRNEKSKGVTLPPAFEHGNQANENMSMKKIEEWILAMFDFLELPLSPQKNILLTFTISFLQCSLSVGLYRAHWKFTNIVSSFPFIASNGGNPPWPILATMATISTTRCAVDAAASLVGNWRGFHGWQERQEKECRVSLCPSNSRS